MKVDSQQEEEVIRLPVRSRPQESFKDREWDILAFDLGILTHASIGRTLIAFTDPSPVGLSKLLGVEIPGGTGSL